MLIGNNSFPNQTSVMRVGSQPQQQNNMGVVFQTAVGQQSVQGAPMSMTERSVQDQKLQKAPCYAELSSLIKSSAQDTSGTPQERIDRLFVAIQEYIDENLFTIDDRCELLLLLLNNAEHFQQKIAADIGTHASVTRTLERQYPLNLYNCIAQSMMICEPIDFVRLIDSIKSSGQLSKVAKDSAVENLLQKLFERLTNGEEDFTYQEIYHLAPAFAGHLCQKNLLQKAANLCLQHFNTQYVDSGKFNLIVFNKLLKELQGMLSNVDMSMERNLLAQGENKLLQDAVSRVSTISEEAVKKKLAEIKVEKDPLAIDFSAYSCEEDEDEDLTPQEELELQTFKMLQKGLEDIATGQFPDYDSTELTAIKPQYDQIAAMLALAPLQIDNIIENDIILQLIAGLQEAVNVNLNQNNEDFGLEMYDDYDADPVYLVQLAQALQMSRQRDAQTDPFALIQQFQKQILQEKKGSPAVFSILQSLKYALNQSNKAAALDLLSQLAKHYKPNLQK